MGKVANRVAPEMGAVQHTGIKLNLHLTESPYDTDLLY